MMYLSLFWTFFKIGAFTFGGGYAMLALIQSEVTAHGWMALSEVVDFVAVSESTPGPLAVNLSTFVGQRVGGFFGAVCATLGVVLPSFLLILLVARCYTAFQKSRVVSGCMAGLRPAVLGMIGTALFSVAGTVLLPSGALVPDVKLAAALGIFALSAVLAFRKVHPIVILCLSAVLGIAAGYLLPLGI